MGSTSVALTGRRGGEIFAAGILCRICQIAAASKFGKRLILLVPVERIELPTFGLQNRCSTAELNRLFKQNQLVATSADSFVSFLSPVAKGGRGAGRSNIRVVLEELDRAEAYSKRGSALVKFRS